MRRDQVEITPTDEIKWEFHNGVSEFTITNYYGSTTLDCSEALKLASFITDRVSEFGS